jgi:predicted nucleotidyltransferase
MISDHLAARYLDSLTEAYPRIREVWLIGSRANGSARAESDWDYLVFADRRILRALRQDTRFRHPSVDLLVVYDGDQFATPWGEPNPKKGSLTSWDWELLSAGKAEYTAAKIKPDSMFPDLRKKAAIRVWPRAE